LGKSTTTRFIQPSLNNAEQYPLRVTCHTQPNDRKDQVLKATPTAFFCKQNWTNTTLNNRTVR